MRLASFASGNEVHVGVVAGDELVDLAVVDADLPREMSVLLASGAAARPSIEAAVASGRGRVELGTTRLLAPVLRPQKFLAVGLNYADHIAEFGLETPEFPTVFAKMPSSIAGPYDDVEVPRISPQLDYEGELGFVIGRRCRHVPRERAHEVIAGFLVVNDYSVRDVQMRTSQWILGKSFDTHGVIGPWIVTPDEIDPHTLDIRTIVNGKQRQHSNTKQLIFDCFAQVELLSAVCTLEPGDIVATGTPSGIGMATDSYLVAGDTVRVEIDGIGEIENLIVDEPAASP